MKRGRIGFTTRACCLIAAGLTAIVCGFLFGVVDLVRAGVLVVAVPFAAAVVVHRSRVRVANRRSVEPAHVTAGQSVVVHLAITNRAMLPTGALMLEDQLPAGMPGHARFVLDSLAGRATRTASYRMPTLGRGRYHVGPLRIQLRDPFHMIDLTRSFTATTEFVVTPVIDHLSTGEPARTDELGEGGGSHSVGSHGADDASTREYRIGDDLRKIHWRSSARTGALMVRQEERPWRAQTTLLLDLRARAHRAAAGVETAGTDPRERSSLEWAVSACASLGAQALRGGRDVGLIGDPGHPQRVRFADVGHLSTHLALVREHPDTTMGRLESVLRATARDSAVFAVLGALGADDLQLLADTPPRGRSSPAVALLLDVDSWVRPTGEPVAAAGFAPGEAPIERTSAVLRAAGWRTVVVRRGMPVALAWRTLAASGGHSSVTAGLVAR